MGRVAGPGQAVVLLAYHFALSSWNRASCKCTMVCGGVRCKKGNIFLLSSLLGNRLWDYSVQEVSWSVLSGITLEGEWRREIIHRDSQQKFSRGLTLCFREFRTGMAFTLKRGAFDLCSACPWMQAAPRRSINSKWIFWPGANSRKIVSNELIPAYPQQLGEQGRSLFIASFPWHSVFLCGIVERNRKANAIQNKQKNFFWTHRCLWN